MGEGGRQREKGKNRARRGSGKKRMLRRKKMEKGSKKGKKVR